MTVIIRIMKYSISILLLLQAAALVTAAAAPETNSDQPDYCKLLTCSAPISLLQLTSAGVQSQPDLNSTTIPRSYGVVLFRGF
ncbi:UNVERIFIED_CONTAM: hypothetical protein NY603_17535, partial [Bacteroidetes bacterium 56_B9]